MNDGFWLIAALGILFVSQTQTQEPTAVEPDAGFIAGGGGGAPGPSTLAKIIGGLGLNGIDPAPIVAEASPGAMVEGAGDPGPGFGTLFDAVVEALTGQPATTAIGDMDTSVGMGDVADGSSNSVGGGDTIGISTGTYDPVYVELVDRGSGSFSVTGSPEDLAILTGDPSKGLMLSGWGGPLGADINIPGGLDVLTQSLIQHGPPINGDDDGDDPDEIMYDPVFVDLVDRGSGSYSIRGAPEELELLVADPTRGVVVSGWGGPLGADVNFPQGIAVVTESLIEHGVPIGGDDS